MIEKIYKNKYMVTCDNCGTGQECDSWADVMDFIKKSLSTDNGGNIMIERNNEVDYDLICDICGYTVSGFDAFYEAVDYKKENGWKSQKHNGQWEDICPECQEG